MLPLLLLGLLLILWLFWMIKVKQMLEKGGEIVTGCGTPAAAAQEEMQAADRSAAAAHTPAPPPTKQSTPMGLAASTSTDSGDNRPLTHIDPTVGPMIPRVGGSSEEMKHTQPSLPFVVPQPPSRTIRPKLISGLEARQARPKFILGASEDNSSDEDLPLTMKPPTGFGSSQAAATSCLRQTVSATSTTFSPPQQVTSVTSTPTSNGMR
ncbi:uncharacterized protein LOC135565279 [Oncorhynchus nerka]|uniref:uncharacterized protein LOC135565279 n=1 Tax=Oncorhynchus nerka TaxID=8023 RepID=UPI0031B8A889